MKYVLLAFLYFISARRQPRSDGHVHRPKKTEKQLNIFKKAAAASALAVLACGSASAAVITFDDFYSEAGASHYLPILTYANSSYTADGYTFASSGGVVVHHAVVGSLLSLDSTLGASIGVTTTLSSGGNFSLSSLDLTALTKETVTFTAVTAAGATVQESFTSKFGTSTFNFTNPAFADVKSVSWTQSSNILKDYAVDNVTLAAAVPEPATYAMLFAGLGLLGFMGRRKKSA
jgi:hypothetical protein